MELLQTSATSAGFAGRSGSRRVWQKPARRSCLGHSGAGKFRQYLRRDCRSLHRIEGKPVVHKVTAAIDCGWVVNPDTAKAQIESGVIFGLTAAMYGEITIKEGRVSQNNFPDYEMVRMATSPEIDVHLIESGASLGGLGEPATPRSPRRSRMQFIFSRASESGSFLSANTVSDITARWPKRNRHMPLLVIGLLLFLSPSAARDGITRSRNCQTAFRGCL